MTEPTAEPSFHIHNREDLIEVTPYLLGYRPIDSLVVIALAGGGELRLTIRSDLTEAAEPVFAAELMTMVEEAGGEQIVLIVYGPPCGSPPAEEEAEIGQLPYDDLVYDIADVARHAGIRFIGGVFVADDRWWTYEPCANSQCCRPEGTPLDAPGPRIAAEATYAGLTVLPDRDAIIASLRPIRGPAQAGFSAALAAAQQELVDAAGGRDVIRWRAGALIQLRAVLERVRGGDLPWLSDRVAARLVVGLADTRIRDRAWTWLEADPAGRWSGGAQLWRQLARRAPEEYRTPPMFLYAWACWRGGDGVRARIGLELALSGDPDYVAALLLEQALGRGLDPAQVPALLPRSGQSARFGMTGRTARPTGMRPAARTTTSRR
jgi:hypothetical protein